MSYKLSHTAQEVDELLGKVKGGVCLPVVELSTILTAEGSKLTDAENAKLSKVSEMGLPIVLIATIHTGDKISAVCTHLITPGEANSAVISASTESGRLLFMKMSDTVWAGAITV